MAFIDPMFPKVPPLVRTILLSVLVIVSMVLAAYAQTQPMGKLDSSGNIGIINYELDVTFTYHKADYSVHVNTSSGGLLGGLGGGIERHVNDSLYYVTGMDNFEGDIGMVVDSYPSKDYELNFSRRDGTESYFVVVEVHYSVDTNPWWVVGRGETFRFDITVLKVNDPLFSHAVIDRLEIEVWKDYVERDDNDRAVYDYTDRPEKPIWKKDLSSRLDSPGDSRDYSASIALEENYGKVGLVGLADVTVYYTDNTENSDALAPFSSTSHPNTINIYTMERTTAARIGGAVLAGPFCIAGIILAAVGLVFNAKGRRKGAHRALGAAGVLEIMSSALFYSGLTALVGLIEFVGDDLTFYPTLYLPAMAGVLLLVATVMSMVLSRGEGGKKDGGKVSFKVKDKGSGTKGRAGFKVKGKAGSRHRRNKKVSTPGTGEGEENKEVVAEEGAEPPKAGAKFRVKFKGK